MNIAVYCGSVSGNKEQFEKGARALGTWIGEHVHDPLRYSHKREASASRYANTGQDCESAQHGAIRQASYILLYVNDPSCFRIYSM